MHCFIFLSVLLLFLCAPMFAQEDRRVSIEPTTAVLPAEIQIQAAGSIGANTLVVWGGNRQDGANKAISILHSQLLRGTVAEGSPRQLHSDEARPEKFVAVVPFDSRYLVVWNDARAIEPGAYMQWVDSAGVPIGQEEIFSRQFIRDSASLQTFRTPAGVMIFRIGGDSLARLYMRRLTHEGSLLADEHELAAAATVAVDRHAGFDDLFRVRAGARTYLLAENGMMETRSIPASRFTGAWYIGRDSSFLALKETTLHYYSSVFDSIPKRSITLTALRAIEAPGAVITADTSGVQVTYPYCNLMDASTYYTVWIWVKRIIVNPAGTVSSPVVIDSIASHNGAAGVVHSTMGSVIVTAGCGNSRRVRVTHVAEGYNARETIRLGTSYRQWGYTIGESGEYRAEPVAPAPTPCLDPAGVLAQPAVIRIKYSDSSTVRIADRADLPQVGTRVTPFIAIAPGELPIDGKLAVGRITPNPATGVAVFAMELIEPGDATAEIIDMSGQALIRHSQFYDAGVHRWEIDVSDLNNGLYILKVHSGGRVVMMKLMVRTE